MDVMKLYIQMPMSGFGSLGVSVSFESEPACSDSKRPVGAAVHSVLRLSSPPPHTHTPAEKQEKR